jgi:hypothetical protein
MLLYYILNFNIKKVYNCCVNRLQFIKVDRSVPGVTQARVSQARYNCGYYSIPWLYSYCKEKYRANFFKIP